MIDICAFFEYTTDVSRGKMVTIHRKNLLASCLFLLGYSSFFLLAVSGSYDYTASGAFASELEPSNPEKHRSEWLSNHEWDDYTSLKGNYHSRRKSRSTLEKETSRAKEAPTEETSQGAEGKWVPRRKRKFERSVGLESIGKNASGSVQEEKENADAIKNTTIEPTGNGNNLENDTRKEVSDDRRTVKDRLKDEVSVEKGKEKKNTTEILEIRSEKPRFPTELGQESPNGEPEDGGRPTQRWSTSLKLLPKEILEKISRLKDHRHRKGGKKGGVPNIGFENSEDHDEDFEEDEEEEGEDAEEEKEETDHVEPKENGQAATNVSSSAMELYKIMSDVFLPMRNNETGMGRYPWRALTSSRYTKEITKQEGPHLKRTMKETQSKVSLFFANDVGRTAEGRNDSTNPPKIDDSEVLRTNRLVEKGLSERDLSMEKTTSEPIKVTTTGPVKMTTTEPIKVTTSEPKKVTTTEPIKVTTSEPIKVTTSEPIKMTTTELPKREECEKPKETFERSWVSNEKDESHDTIYNILDASVLFVTNILDLREQPIPDWY